MPHYSIHHSIPLTPQHLHSLATRLTTLHCTLFSAPSAFVNITFHPTFTSTSTSTSPQSTTTSTTPTFVGGKYISSGTNYMHAHLRPRSGPEHVEKRRFLVKEIMRIWDDTVLSNDSNSNSNSNSTSTGKVEKEEHAGFMSGRLDDSRALHNVFIMEDIVAGAEQGFILPVAGEEGKWVEENMGAFEERVRMGDESVRRLIEEVKTLGLVGKK